MSKYVTCLICEASVLQRLAPAVSDDEKHGVCGTCFSAAKLGRMTLDLLNREVKPRVDAAGVPWCHGKKCPSFQPGTEIVGRCKMLGEDVFTYDMCRPAVMILADEGRCKPLVQDGITWTCRVVMERTKEYCARANAPRVIMCHRRQGVPCERPDDRRCDLCGWRKNV